MTRYIITIVLACVASWFVLGLHLVRKPTPDQLYGCTMKQQLRTPNQEDCP